MRQGLSGTATWRLKNWSKCHTFLTASCSCSLQVGNVSLRFFLRPLEKTFQNGSRDTIVVTIQYYSLWMEVISFGEYTKLFLNVHTKVTPSYSERYNPGKPDSQVAVTGLSPNCANNREVMVQERFIYMGSYTTNLGNRNFGVELLYDGANEVSIDIQVTLFHFNKKISTKELGSKTTTSTSSSSSVNSDGTLLLSKELSRLLEEDGENNFHDFQLKMKDGVILQVHRTILCARSPVFRALFSSGMKESTCDVVEIPDIGSDAMRVILKYMYTGIIEDSWGEYATEVVYGASKYDLPKLLEHCDNQMIAFCTVTNAVELYRVAKLHSLPNAMQSIRVYTKANTADVLLSTGTD